MTNYSELTTVYSDEDGTFITITEIYEFQSIGDSRYIGLCVEPRAFYNQMLKAGHVWISRQQDSKEFILRINAGGYPELVDIYSTSQNISSDITYELSMKSSYIPANSTDHWLKAYGYTVLEEYWDMLVSS